MAQLLVRNIEDSVKTRLKQRAKTHGRSMEEEARDILRSALCEEEANPVGMGTQIANLFRGIGFDEEISELKGNIIRPVVFEP